MRSYRRAPAMRWLRAALIATSVAAIAVGCSRLPSRDGEPLVATGSTNKPDAVPRPEPRSRYGNGPVYEVLGQSYRVMDSSSGYKERGVASWYGKKFHGRLTSNREPYDMYAMTAAHKTLPFGTEVKVTDLETGRSIKVRINDRGPFVEGRIIDLSRKAAKQLGMHQRGITRVRIEVKR